MGQHGLEEAIFLHLTEQRLATSKEVARLLESHR